MTTVLHLPCPHCGKVLRIPADWLDEPLRCRHCGQSFQARPTPAAARSSSAPSDRGRRLGAALGLAALGVSLLCAVLFGPRLASLLIRPDRLPIEPGKREPTDNPAAPRAKSPPTVVDPWLPLPILAQPAPEPASAPGPTALSSLTAGLQATPPERTGPAPFVRMSLPDPFEHRNAVRQHSPPGEEPVPSILSAQPLRP